MRKWIINILGGYTSEEMLDFANRRCVNELKHIKYTMEENYGSNWLAEIYDLVNNRLIELHERIG